MTLVCVAHGAWLVTTRGVYAALLQPQLYVSVAHIEIVIGLIGIVNCFVSLYSLTRQLRCILYSHAVAAVIISLMLAVGATMAYVFRYQLVYQTPMQLKMLTSLREVYGKTDAEGKDLTDAWDAVQTNVCILNQIHPTSDPSLRVAP